MSITIPYTFNDGAVARAAQVNANFATVYDQVNQNTDDITTNSAAINNLGYCTTLKMHGAAGNGIDDDTVAIQSALNSGASVVLVTQGTYIFTHLHVPSNTIFMGYGGSLKLKDNTCTSVSTDYYLIENLGESGTVFDGLYIDGNKYNQVAYNVADAITCVGDNSKVINCTIINSPDSGIMWSATSSDSNNMGECSNNHIHGGGDCGIYVNALDSGKVGISGTIVSNNRISGYPFAGIGIKRYSGFINIEHNSIDNCGNGITVENSGGSMYPERVNISGNIVKRVGTNFLTPWSPLETVNKGDFRTMAFTDSFGSWTANVVALNYGTTGSSQPTYNRPASGTHWAERIPSIDGTVWWQVDGPRTSAVGISLSAGDDIVVIGNCVYDVEGIGINAGAMKSPIISNNRIKGNGSGTYLPVLGNSGIVFSGTTSTDVVITNNSVSDFRTYGIRLDSISGGTVSSNTVDVYISGISNNSAMYVGDNVSGLVISTNYLKGASRAYDVVYTSYTTGKANSFVSNYRQNGNVIEKCLRYFESVSTPISTVTPWFAGERVVTTVGGYKEWVATNDPTGVLATDTTYWRFVGGASDSGTVAPSTTPIYIGQQYIDASAKKVYISTGTSSSDDWTVVN